jgi:YegS/Rv2252/BmrU family lipid kinase
LNDVVVVLNRRSRRTRSDAARVLELLHRHGVRVAAVHVAEDHDELRAHVKRAAKAGTYAVLAGGGDGTMAHAVDALAHRDTILGVLPLGTGNSFARSLGLDPNDLDGAVRAVASGHVQRVDLGRVNGTYFANFATIGISSAIAGSTARPVKRWSGALAYAAAAIRPLGTHRAFRARIRWPGGRLDLRTQDIIIANGRFFGATPLAPDASLRDGRLTLYVNADPSRGGAILTYLALLLKRQSARPGAHVISAEEFTIRARAKQRIALDGSLFEKTPARLRVAREALRVFVPRNGIAHD